VVMQLQRKPPSNLLLASFTISAFALLGPDKTNLPPLFNVLTASLGAICISMYVQGWLSIIVEALRSWNEGNK